MNLITRLFWRVVDEEPEWSHRDVEYKEGSAWDQQCSRDNKLWFIVNPLAQHVSVIIMPIFRSVGPYITAYGFQHLMCSLVSWELLEAGRMPIFRSVGPYITAYGLQHIKCWKPYAVIYGATLLKMGIMMTETCWAYGLLINHNLLHLVGLTSHFVLKCSRGLKFETKEHRKATA